MYNIDAHDLRMGSELLRALGGESNPKKISEIIVEKPMFKCGATRKKWDYEFSSDFLKNPSELVRYCKKNGLEYCVKMNGIMVRKITEKQINEARKIANKKSQSYKLKINR